jgi:hypothetical protein
MGAHLGSLFLGSVLAEEFDDGVIGFGFSDTRALIISREQKQAFS